jgi:PKD repeat protein
MPPIRPSAPARSVPRSGGVLLAVLTVLVVCADTAAALVPRAAFSVTPRRPDAGQAVTFVSRSQPNPATATIVGEEWDFDGDGSVDATGPSVTWTFPAAGSYVVTLRVRDAREQTGAATRTVLVAPPPLPPLPPPPPPRDTRPPNTSFVSGPGGTTSDVTPTFTFGSRDASARFECSVDRGAWFSCASPHTLGEQGSGSHSLAVRAVDPAGNADPTPAVRTFRVVGSAAGSTPPTTVSPAPATPPPATSPAGSANGAGTPTPAPASPSSGTSTTASTAGLTAFPALLPSPIVRITGSYSRRGVRLRLVAVTAPLGASVTVRCSGRGCPYRQRGPRRVVRSGTKAAGAARYLVVPGFRRRLLRPGVKLEVLVSRPGRIGKYTSFRIRSSSPPARRDTCLRPDKSVVRCS